MWQSRIWWPIEGFKGIHAAAFAPSLEKISACLDAGTDANVRVKWQIGSEEFECTPVLIAVLRGNVDAVRLLMEHGSDPTIPGTVTLEVRGVYPTAATHDALWWAKCMFAEVDPELAQELLVALQPKPMSEVNSQEDQVVTEVADEEKLQAAAHIRGRMVKVCVWCDGGGACAAIMASDATVADVKRMLQRCGHGPADLQHLKFGGTELTDSLALLEDLAGGQESDPCEFTVDCLSKITLQLSATSSMEDCPICKGSGLIYAGYLDDCCPLCEGEVKPAGMPATS